MLSSEQEISNNKIKSNYLLNPKVVFKVSPTIMPKYPVTQLPTTISGVNFILSNMKNPTKNINIVAHA